mmetsp:Transcript_4331/g.7010  ORF Transcript_4331/g.7010 Transcript_4331/m.7010 type:complete len:107 (-) Transcript_4331:982-1302(-)
MVTIRMDEESAVNTTTTHLYLHLQMLGEGRSMDGVITAAAAAAAEVVTVAVGQSSNIVMPKILTELEQEHSFEHAADGDGTVSGGGGGVAGEGSIRLNLSPRNNQE